MAGREAVPQNIITQKHLAKRKAVVDAVNALVAHHLPDATPYRLDEHALAFSADEHKRDDQSPAVRIMAPPKGDEDMFPQFLHFSFSLRPDGVTQDHSIRSSREYFNELRADINRLFTGTGAGEQMPVVVAKEAGKPTAFGSIDRVMASMSEQYPQGSINLILHGTPEELYDRMRLHLAENPDLQKLVPKAGREVG